jgi:pimeloyl-ACP methyl ester carboxylesterase
MYRREFIKLAALNAGLAISTGAGSGLAVGQQLAASGSAVGQRAASSSNAGSGPVRDRLGTFTFYSPLAEEWYRGGSHFDWKSTTPNNGGRSVRVFYRTFGNHSNPALLLIHGYYLNSFDFRDMVRLLQDKYFLCVLDFPGFGFSDKPQDNYSYMLKDDAKLVDYFVREIVELTRFSILAHDRGGSVMFEFLGDYLDASRRNYEITYHFIMNGGLFLPLANLSQGQRDMLDPVRGPELIKQARTRPRVMQGTPRDVAEADMLTFNDGVGAQLHVGKYLLERAKNEWRWLANLQQSPLPTALLWGLTDPVNPPRIANYIWSNYLNGRAVESSFWILPTAGHTLHVEKPEQVTEVVLNCLNGRVPAPERENAFMLQLARERKSPDAAVYIGRTHDVVPMVFPGAVEYTPAGYHY